jgi:hypothetical protein
MRMRPPSQHAARPAQQQGQAGRQSATAALSTPLLLWLWWLWVDPTVADRRP